MKKNPVSENPTTADSTMLLRRARAANIDCTITIGVEARPEELALIPHPGWVPAQVRDFFQLRNGFYVAWRADTNEQVRGKVDIRPLQVIYGDWRGIVWFDSEPAAQQARMQAFKIVDFFADEACVGLFHSADQDPQLYFYDFEDPPRPLGVDFMGYLALLPHTLGLRYWPLLLLELGAPTPTTRPWRPQQPAAQELVQLLRQYVPDFDLDALVQRYDEVRLPR